VLVLTFTSWLALTTYAAYLQSLPTPLSSIDAFAREGCHWSTLSQSELESQEPAKAAPTLSLLAERHHYLRREPRATGIRVVGVQFTGWLKGVCYESLKTLYIMVGPTDDTMI
jgi:hypothetical protein